MISYRLQQIGFVIVISKFQIPGCNLRPPLGWLPQELTSKSCEKSWKVTALKKNRKKHVKALLYFRLDGSDLCVSNHVIEEYIEEKK